MDDGIPPKPSNPGLPAYIQDPLESQSPERLEEIAGYATSLAEWKRTKRALEIEEKRGQEALDERELESLENRNLSTDAEDYQNVPSSGAYITIKETKPGYQYYYWQWREGNSWKNEYIAPVSPKRG